MPENVCALCKGQSWTEQIIGNEVVPFRCACFKRRLALSYLGPELARAAFRRSALYRLEVDPETKEVVGDRTLDDLFIKGTWAEVSQHLRWAVGAKHHDTPSFTFKMVNDEMLLRVRLGDFSYGNRSKQVRDEIVTYNNITDLVGECSLLIVRLGMMVHNNKMAANILSETLNLRAAASKATWLVEGDGITFGEGHPFYSYAVGDYVENNFEIINVGGDVEAARRMEAELQAMTEHSLSLGEESDRAPSPQAQERYRAEPDAWQLGQKQQPKWKKGSGKRTGGGLGGLES